MKRHSIERHTIASLKMFLEDLENSGVPSTCQIGVYADPEGNEVWPLRKGTADWGRLVQTGMRFDVISSKKNIPEADDMIFFIPGY